MSRDKIHSDIRLSNKEITKSRDQESNSSSKSCYWVDRSESYARHYCRDNYWYHRGDDQSVWCAKEALSDNATNFTSKANELLAQKLGVHHVTITPYNPAANGQVEKINVLIIQTLRFYIDRNATNWDIFLPYATFAINSAENPRTKVSPYFLFFGRDSVAPRKVDVPQEATHKLNEYTKSLLENVETWSGTSPNSAKANSFSLRSMSKKTSLMTNTLDRSKY